MSNITTSRFRFARAGQRIAAQRERIGPPLRVHRDVDPPTQRFELIDRRGALDVGCNHQGAAVELVPDEAGQLRGGRRFTRALQAHHHDGGDPHGRKCDRIGGRAARTAHERFELFLADRDEPVIGGNLFDLTIAFEARGTLDDLLFSSFFNPAQEILGHIEGYIGLEQREPDVPQRIIQRASADRALPCQLIFGGFEASGDGLEHDRVRLPITVASAP